MSSDVLDARARLDVLTRTIARLGAVTELATTLEETIAACLPLLGDFGFFDLRFDRQEVQRTARAHEDERIETILRPTQWVRSERRDMNLCALSSGEVGLHPAIDDAWYRAIAVNDGHLELLRTLAFCSMLTIPMRFGDELVGAFTLFFGRSGRSHSEAHVAFAQELAAAVVPLVVNARLVEQQRRAEERLRLATVAGKLGIWDWHVERDEVVWTDRVYQVLGLVPGTFGGKVGDFVALVHPDDRDRVSATIEAALASGPSYACEMRTLVDGEVRWLVTHGSVIRDDSGRAVRLVGTVHDDSERVKIFAEIDRARREAEANTRAKDDFLAMLGHELRNPLAPIVSALDLMNIKGDASTKREREIIARQAHHLARLVDDLLDVTQIVRGSLVVAKERAELASVLDKALEMSRTLLDARAIRVDFLRPLEPLWVEGDPVRLTQVFANLLGNAAKFARPAGGHVAVAMRTVGELHEVIVRDDGVGIEAELLPRVFDPFVQGSQSLDRREGGMGLGLAIVSNLVAAHGGSVHADSAGKGRGATFTVRLPRTSVGTVTRPSEPLPAPLQTGKLLVIDDNADALLLVCDLLRGRGYEVVSETDGERGLQIAEAFRPDLAILDLGLPGLDGLEVARRLREQPAHADLRMIALSGFGQASDREATRRAGFDRHLVKPISVKTLVDTVSELMQR